MCLQFFLVCGKMVFCRLGEYRRAHPLILLLWYFHLQELCLQRRPFFSLEESRDWINVTTREHFIFFLNSPFKPVHADSQNVTAKLRKNICFPYRKNKNVPKLSFKNLSFFVRENHAEHACPNWCCIAPCSNPKQNPSQRAITSYPSFLSQEMLPNPQNQFETHHCSVPCPCCSATWNRSTSGSSHTPHIPSPFVTNQTSSWPSWVTLEDSWGLAQLETLHLKTQHRNWLSSNQQHPSPKHTKQTTLKLALGKICDCLLEKKKVYCCACTFCLFFKWIKISDNQMEESTSGFTNWKLICN